VKGTVKFFNEMKGFGFVAGEDGKEYFVHKSGLKEGVRLNENDAVTFDVEQGDRGPKAGNVQLDSGDSGAAPEESEDKGAEEDKGADEGSDEEKEEDKDSAE